jgi:hypothetical protein
VDRILLYLQDGLEEDAGCGVRRVWAQVDTGIGEPAKLPIQEMPLDAMGQGWRGRADTGSTDQDGAEP